MKQFFKKTLNLSTIYYTIGIIAFCAIMLAFHSGEDSISMDPTRFLFIYPFCLSLATANVILKHTNIQAVARWILHFTLIVFGAYLFIILPANLETSSGNFMGLMIILAMYIVGSLFTILLSKRIKSAMREDAEIQEKAKRNK